MGNFTCDQCGCNYLYRHNLQRHVKRNHTDHPVFICDQCERSFARSGNLEKHKAVDPAVGAQPPVTLTLEMVAVYSDAVTPLEDVYRQLLNFIEVYKHNGSG